MKIEKIEENNMEKIKKIPNLNIQDNKIINETKDIKIFVNDVEDIVTIKKFTNAEFNAIIDKCINITNMGNQQKTDINNGEFRNMTISSAIVKASFDTSIEGIENLPYNITEYLFNEINDFNYEIEKKNI